MHDLDWVVEVLADRRTRREASAPIFWRPAPDAAASHKRFLEGLLTDGGAVGYRTDHSLLLATPWHGGWLIDDAAVAGEAWQAGDGGALWDALTSETAGARVRFVCPVVEPARADFAAGVGLTRQQLWWLLELPGSGGGEAGVEVDLPGAVARTVSAPPVYAPPGPVLFLSSVSETTSALPAALEAASQRGCAAIVVDQPADDLALSSVLQQAGFRRHCDYYTGIL